MEQKDFNIKKYPKSVNKFQCIGPCYYPRTIAIHPTMLEIIANNDHPFCPVNEWTHTDASTGRTKTSITDKCFNPTDDGDNMENKDLELNILTPYVDFNTEQFLKIYYKIFSFEDALDWCDKYSYLPLDTQIRIIKCSLSQFGKNIDIIDNRFTYILINIIKKKKI